MFSENMTSERSFQLTWVTADQRSVKLPLGTRALVRNGLEEDVEHSDGEGRQAGVEDDVEASDLEPGERSPAEDGAVVRVDEEESDRLQPGPVPARRLDGHCPQQLLVRRDV